MPELSDSSEMVGAREQMVLGLLHVLEHISELAAPPGKKQSGNPPRDSRIFKHSFDFNNNTSKIWTLQDLHEAETRVKEVRIFVLSCVLFSVFTFL